MNVVEHLTSIVNCKTSIDSRGGRISLLSKKIPWCQVPWRPNWQETQKKEKYQLGTEISVAYLRSGGKENFDIKSAPLEKNQDPSCPTSCFPQKPIDATEKPTNRT